MLTQAGPPPWHLASDEIKRVCAQAAEYCKQRGVNIVELAIQFAVANPHLATTFVGSAIPEEVTANVAWAEEPLDMELLAEVEKILAPIHNQSWASGLAENN